MPGKGNNKKGPAGPPETPEQTIARLEKKLQDKALPAAAVTMIKQQIEQITQSLQKAAAEATTGQEATAEQTESAANAAAAEKAARDEQRQAQIAEAYAAFKAAEQEATAAVEAARANLRAAVAVCVKEDALRESGSYKSNERMIRSPALGPVFTNNNRSGINKRAAERAVEQTVAIHQQRVDEARLRYRDLKDGRV